MGRPGRGHVGHTVPREQLGAAGEICFFWPPPQKFVVSRFRAHAGVFYCRGVATAAPIRHHGGTFPDEVAMLTPAEELGLSGLSLASRVRRAFYKIPPADIVRL